MIENSVFCDIFSAVIEATAGTATGGSGNDYEPAFPTTYDANSYHGFYFYSGKTRACRTITINDDGNDEDEETVTFGIQGDSDGNFVSTTTPVNTVLTITDDDGM